MSSREPSSQFPLQGVLIGLLVYCAVLLPLIGIPLIGGSSEAREAQVIEVMQRTGEFVLPLRNGIIPSKPPMYHWIGYGVSFLVGEVSEFTARVPSLLLAMGVLLFVSIIAHRYARFLQRSDQTLALPAVAYLAPSFLALTYGFHIMVTQAMVDMTFAFFVWGAFCALVATDSREWQSDLKLSPLSAFFFWMCVAGGVLSRGPLGAGLILFMAFVAGWRGWGIEVAIRNLLTPRVGWLWMVVPVIWYAAAYDRGGDAFLGRQLFFENMQRVVGGEHINSEAWWFYVPSLLRTTFPWGIVLIGIAALEGRRRPHRLLSRDLSRLFRLPLFVLLVTLIALSLPSGKRHSYMLPLYPFVALQLSLFVSRAVGEGRLTILRKLSRGVRRFESVLVSIGILLLVGLGAFIQGGFGSGVSWFLVRDEVLPISLTISIVLLCTLLPGLFKGEQSLGRSSAGAGLALLGVLAVITCAGSSIKAGLKDFPGMSRTLLSLVAPGEKIAVIKGTYEEYFDPILFYVHREVTILDAEAERLQCEQGVLYVARREWMERAERAFQGSIAQEMVLRERIAEARAVTKRDLVVFRCVTGRSTPEAPVGGVLRDA